jgi:hypothetical protein
LAGKPITDADGLVYIAGASDPWVTRQPSAHVIEAADAERRAALIDAYYTEQRREKPRIVDGTSEWMAD